MANYVPAPQINAQKKLKSCAAAASMLIVLAVIDLISSLVSLRNVKYVFFVYSPAAKVGYFAGMLLPIVFCIVVAIFLFLKKRNALVPIFLILAAAFNALKAVTYVINNYQNVKTLGGRFVVGITFAVLAFAFVFIAYLFAAIIMLSALKKEATVKIWFLPPLIYVFTFLFNIVATFAGINGGRGVGMVSVISVIINSLFGGIFVTLFLFLVLAWWVKPYKTVYTPQIPYAPQPQYVPQPQYNPQPAPQQPYQNNQ